MHSVSDALALVLEHARRLQARMLPVTADLLELVLAEDIASDMDMPPHDKSMMDGFAVRSADCAGRALLNVIEEVLAGQTPTRSIGPMQATRIMTGAPIPEGADAVVPIEHVRVQGDQVLIETPPARVRANILDRAREMRRGDKVLPAGTLLTPQVFGLLATVGRPAVQVYPRPQVAVLATGDELVEVGEPGASATGAPLPGPGQIRNSNGPMLLAQVAQAGGQPRSLGIARDNRDSLRTLITAGLQSAVLVLSGGVSAGKVDLVPEILGELGVVAHFHKVAMKPGKPVFFGTHARAGGEPACLVFGLPGNPVSSLVCFELFVRPALRQLMGLEPGPAMLSLALAEDFSHRTDRPTYYPARLDVIRGLVHPLPWFGSSDLRALVPANGFILLPTGDHQHRAGQVFPCLPMG